MKYLLFWEQKEINPEERTKFSRRAREERRDEAKYGKVVLPPHFYATYKGVTVVEIDDPRQLANRMALVAPYTHIKALPLIRSTMYSEAVEELDRSWDSPICDVGPAWDESAVDPEIAMPIHRRDKEPLEFKEKVELRSNVKVLVMNKGDEVTL